MPSTLKKAARFQNRLKLSINLKSFASTADWSQVLRLKSPLKRQFPRPNVGMGPEIKNILPLCLHKLKRQLNSSLIVSDPLVKMSLVPTWIIILIIEDGSVYNKYILSRTTTGSAGRPPCYNIYLYIYCACVHVYIL